MPTPVALGGLYSGLDTNTLIQRLLDVQRARLQPLQKQKSLAQGRISAWDAVSSALSKLDSAATKLTQASTYQAMKATSSDATVVTASASGTASPGVHIITITQLAQAHSVASQTFSSATSPISSTGGTITINGVNISVTTSDTLTDLANKINAQVGTVNASVVQVSSSSYRLVLTHKQTGAANTITVSDPSNILGTLTTLTAAQDASFTVDNLTITSSSNTVTTALPGVTLNLLKTGTATVTVSRDTDSVAAAVQSLVDAYNSLVDTMNQQGATGSQGNAGPLAGDSLLRSLKANLRQAVTGPYSGLTTTLTLRDVGISTGAWGTGNWGKLTLDKAKLVEKLNADPAGVQELISAMAKAVHDIANQALQPSTGTIAIRKDSLQKRVADLDKAIGNMQSRLDEEALRLRLQFSKLESALASLKTQGNTLLLYMSSMPPAP